MPITRKINRAVVDYDDAGSVLNVHVEGQTPLQYEDGTPAPALPFGVDFDSTTFGLKWQTLYPDDDSAAIAVKQYTILGAVVDDLLNTA